MEDIQKKAELALIAAYRLFMEEANEPDRPPIRLRATGEYLDVAVDTSEDESRFVFQRMYGFGPWQALEKEGKYYSYIFTSSKTVYNFITAELINYLDKYIADNNLDPDAFEYEVPASVLEDLHYKESIESWGN